MLRQNLPNGCAHYNPHAGAYEKCSRQFRRCGLEELFCETIDLLAAIPVVAGTPCKNRSRPATDAWRANRLEVWGNDATIIAACRDKRIQNLEHFNKVQQKDRQNLFKMRKRQQTARAQLHPTKLGAHQQNSVTSTKKRRGKARRSRKALSKHRAQVRTVEKTTIRPVTTKAPSRVDQRSLRSSSCKRIGQRQGSNQLSVESASSFASVNRSTKRSPSLGKLKGSSSGLDKPGAIKQRSTSVANISNEDRKTPTEIPRLRLSKIEVLSGSASVRKSRNVGSNRYRNSLSERERRPDSKPATTVAQSKTTRAARDVIKEKTRLEYSSDEAHIPQAVLQQPSCKSFQVDENGWGDMSETATCISAVISARMDDKLSQVSDLFVDMLEGGTEGWMEESRADIMEDGEDKAFKIIGSEDHGSKPEEVLQSRSERENSIGMLKELGYQSVPRMDSETALFSEMFGAVVESSEQQSAEDNLEIVDPSLFEDETEETFYDDGNALLPSESALEAEEKSLEETDPFDTAISAMELSD